MIHYVSKATQAEVQSEMSVRHAVLHSFIKRPEKTAVSMIP